MNEPKICYYIPESQYIEVEGKKQYTPSVIKEGVAGHYPVGGNGKEPWYWGDYETACKAADEMNEKLGISPEEAMKMVGASMFGI